MAHKSNEQRFSRSPLFWVLISIIVVTIGVSLVLILSGQKEGIKKDQKITQLVKDSTQLVAEKVGLKKVVKDLNTTVAIQKQLTAKADASAQNWKGQYYTGLNAWKQEKDGLTKGYESALAEKSGQIYTLQQHVQAMETSLQKSEECYAELQDSMKETEKRLDFYQLEYGNALRILTDNEATWSTIIEGRKARWALKRFDVGPIEVLQQEGSTGVGAYRVGLTPKGKKMFELKK